MENIKINQEQKSRDLSVRAQKSKLGSEKVLLTI